MDDNFKLKSFHIEQYVLHYLQENSQKNSWEVITTFFDQVKQILSEPQIPDRADNSKFIDSYVSELTKEEIELILTNSNIATSIIEKIEQAQSEPQVIKYLEEISIVEEVRKDNVYPITKDHAPTKPWYSGDFR